MRKADNLTTTCAVVTKYGKLNFLEPSGPLRACNGTDSLICNKKVYNLMLTDIDAETYRC